MKTKNVRPEALKFINAIAKHCIEAELRTKVPASVSIAQAILESNWGKSKLSVEANNFFGIKADKSWKGDIVLKPTTEYKNGVPIRVEAKFRKYATIEDSIVDHANFLLHNRRYAKAFECKAGESFCKAIADAGYATDPAYADLLIGLIRQYDLTQYDWRF